MLFNVIEGGAACEMVKWKMGLSCRTLTALKVNFGLEISMNDTNYLIFSQHLPFRINTLC